MSKIVRVCVGVECVCVGCVLVGGGRVWRVVLGGVEGVRVGGCGGCHCFRGARVSVREIGVGVGA